MKQLAEVTFAFRDAKGKTGRWSFWVNMSHGDEGGDFDNGVNGDRLDDLYVFLQEVVGRLSEVIRGAIISCNVTFRFMLGDGVRDFSADDADVEEGFKLTYLKNTTHLTVEQTIPTAYHGYFEDGGFGETTSVYPYDNLAHGGETKFSNLFGLLVLPEESWDGEYGGIVDNRGNRLHNTFPLIEKAFRGGKGE